MLLFFDKLGEDWSIQPSKYANMGGDLQLGQMTPNLD
jgi:hypothetical protein